MIISRFYPISLGDSLSTEVQAFDGTLMNFEKERYASIFLPVIN